jgi:hypothetical protein
MEGLEKSERLKHLEAMCDRTMQIKEPFDLQNRRRSDTFRVLRRPLW